MVDVVKLIWRAGLVAATAGVGATIATAPAIGQADTGDSQSSSEPGPSRNSTARSAAKLSKTVPMRPAPAQISAGPIRATPSPTPTGDIDSPLPLATLAYTRREIRAAAPPTTLPTWVQMYVDPPLPRLVAQVIDSVFDNPPTATPMQVEVTLGKDVASRAIPFTASSSKGNRIIYSVPDSAMPGGPGHGTVTVDNAAGTFTYTPDETYTGTDTFSFVANDAPRIIQPLLDFFGLAAGFRNTSTVTIFNGVPIQPDPDVAAYTNITGDFNMLTYDVGGFTPGILNMLTIGSRINKFDVVNLQDDTVFHQVLSTNAEFPDQTSPQDLFPNGLNTFSAYQIGSMTRIAWDSCTRLCVGSAGFTYSRLGVPGGETIDLYNLSGSNGATEITNADIAQLSTFIQQNSVGRAVIVGGEFGQLYSTDGQTLSQFAAVNGLTDAWVQLEYGGEVPTDAPRCAYSAECEQPDKIFYRSATPLDLSDPASAPVQLFAQTYTNEGLNFRTGSGQDLAPSTPQAVTFGYSVAAVGPTNVDPENWMAKTPGISTLPLTQLPIPGTHDSGSYSVTADSEWALTGKSDFGPLTELPPIIEKFIVKPIAAAWGQTQGLSLAEQFANGIRYVDMRFSYEPDGQIYIEHGLRGTTADDVLAQIGDFAASHPKELLIVDMSHLNAFDSTANTMLISKLNAAFGARLAPRSLGTSATLQNLWDINKNVIVLYGDVNTVNANPNLWPETTLYQPWWDVSTMGELYEQNQSGQANRPWWALWGLTGSATPNINNIVAGLLLVGPTSNYGFITPHEALVRQWVRSDFKSSINLVTEDWIEELGPTPSSYAREVVGAVYETLAARISTTQGAVSYPLAG